MSAKVLVAGIGNIFLGDDAFGVEVVRALAQRALPENVRVVDFGIRGLDLTYALLDGYEAVIMVDAAPRGGRPGTLYVIEPAPGGAGPIESCVLRECDPSSLLLNKGGRDGASPVGACAPDEVTPVDAVPHAIDQSAPVEPFDAP